MEIELKEKRFTLRADLAALMEFEQETGLKFSEIGEDSSIWEVGSLIFYFAKRGAEHTNSPFPYAQIEFLGFIELSQVSFLVTVVGAMLGGDNAPESSQKKAVTKA